MLFKVFDLKCRGGGTRETFPQTVPQCLDKRVLLNTPKRLSLWFEKLFLAKTGSWNSLNQVRNEVSITRGFPFFISIVFQSNLQRFFEVSF